VTALAALERTDPLHTFTIVPATASRFDETGYAREVARRYGTVHHEVVVDSRQLPHRLPAVVRRLGQPNADPITVSTDVLFEAVSAAGFKVALTGDGSDEVFAGYARFVAASRGGPLSDYIDNIAGVAPSIREELLSPELAAAAVPVVTDSAVFARRFTADPLLAAMEFELAHRLPVYHLQRVDHLSATYAVEARVPFCQPAVRAAGRALPAAGLIGADDRVKKALTEVAVERDWVPASVARRPKQPFTFSLAENLFQPDGGFMTWAREVLLDPVAARRGLFRPGAVEKLCVRAEEQRSEPIAQALWSLVVLELWLVEVFRW
jgi:asparagine synthase (glutamine-hydrolysing)